MLVETVQSFLVAWINNVSMNRMIPKNRYFVEKKSTIDYTEE